MKRTLFAVAITAALTVGAGASGEQRGLLTLNDLADIDSVGAATLSPDGRQFALVHQGQIVLVSSDGGWPAQLTTTTGGKSGLDWSADGRSIAFVSQGAIWSVPAAGGQPTRLTDGRPGSGDPRSAADRNPQWAPAAGHAGRSQDTRGQDGRSGAAGRTWVLFETGRRGNNDLAVVSDDGLALNYLTSSAADEGNAAWSPDGTRIAYVERSPEHFSGRLLVADFDAVTGCLTGAPKVLHEAKPDRGGGWSIGRPVWSPDGKQLVVTLQDSGWDKLYLLPAAGGPPRPLTDGESEDDSPVFSPDGRQIAFASNRANLEERHIWITALDGGTPRRLADVSPSVESSPQWSPDGRSIYFVRTTPLEPPSVVVVAATGAKAARPRALLGAQPRNVAAAGFTSPEEVHFKSKDGVDIAGLLYKPAGFKAGVRYPTVLWIHGGPEGQDTFAWDPWALYLTQEGYVVLRPNYRGSSGYGEKFRNLNVEDSGGGELDDVVAGVQYLVSAGVTDPARVAIGGGSHGGTMVAYAVTKSPAVFRAAIELYGVTDRATFNERTNRNSAIRWMRKMGGTPDEKPDVYRKANILPDVPKITAPLLIMHGEDDPQVPPYESVQFVNALKKAGKTYLYFTYPKELHGFSQREHRLDAWQKELAFLQRYLQPEYGRGITSTQDIVLDK